MRFISAIYVSSALLLAVRAAPVPRAPGDMAKARENRDTFVEVRTGGDVFAELDLTARNEIDIELRDKSNESPSERPPGTPGCVVA
ncbi:hypothetical protein C8R44DRAFT_876468 [Mycena epipterygia]|nr:hypothetical protein C8R44DRAFT_876468 [Mycena epipterygia]